MGDGFIIPIRVQRQTAFGPFNFNLGGYLLRDLKVIKPIGYNNAAYLHDIAHGHVYIILSQPGKKNGLGFPKPFIETPIFLNEDAMYGHPFVFAELPKLEDHI